MCGRQKWGMLIKQDTATLSSKLLLLSTVFFSEMDLVNWIYIYETSFTLMEFNKGSPSVFI